VLVDKVMWTSGNSETPRKQRQTFNEPHHSHFLTFSTYHKAHVLLRPGVPELFLQALDEARAKFDFNLYAYVLMPDHAHLILQPRTSPYSIAQILQSVKGVSSKRIFEAAPDLRDLLRVTPPQRHATHRFWEAGGGHDRNILYARTVWKAIEYVHLNPVRKSLCDAPGDWPWSSVHAYEERPTAVHVDVCDWTSF